MTVTVTGSFELQNGDAPLFYRVEFLLSQFDTDDAVIIPSLTVANVSDAGTFTVNLWPNDMGPRSTNYSVSLVGYKSRFYNEEVSRVNLGRIYVLDIPGQTLDELINGGASDPMPYGSALIYVYDNAGVYELRCKFSNGVDKLITNSVA